MDNGRNIVFAFHRIFRQSTVQEIGEAGFRLGQEASSEAPHIHGYGSLCRKRSPGHAFIQRVGRNAVLPLDPGALHDIGQVSAGIGCADTAGDMPILRQRIRQMIARHGVVIAAALILRLCQKAVLIAECLLPIVIIRIDCDERTVYYMAGGQQRMCGSPGLYATFRNGKSFRKDHSDSGMRRQPPCSG